MIENLKYCHSCEFGMAKPRQGVSLPCLTDSHRRPYLQLAKSGICPLGKFTPPDPAPSAPATLAVTLVPPTATSVKFRRLVANAANCTHAVPTARANVVQCDLQLYGGQPHIALCRQCPHHRPLPQVFMKAAAASARDGVARRIPHPPSPAELELAIARAGICNTCQHNRGITMERNSWPVYAVRCGLCGCAGLSLIRGSCRAGKWPQGEAPTGGRVVQSIRTNASNGSAAHAPGLSTPQKLLLKSHLSPGDTVTLTAAVRDLHKAFPGRFVTAVQTTAMELWENNPHLTALDKADPSVRAIPMHYPLVNQSNQRPVHFLRGYTDYLESQLALHIPTAEFRGDIHLSDAEKSWTNQVADTFGYKGYFWLMFAGGKYDFTAKWWSPEHYQKVVDHFRGRIQFVQCGEAAHWHPALTGVFNLVGKTSLRQLVRLMYHAAGVICPVTLAMHLAAAVPTKTKRLRLCVVVAGGREPPHWEAYPGHQFLHTVGMLPCCATGGCWKSRCQKVGDNDPKDRENLCERPVPVRDNLVIPQCMAMIKPDSVIRSVEGYLTDAA